MYILAPSERHRIVGYYRQLRIGYIHCILLHNHISSKFEICLPLSLHLFILYCLWKQLFHVWNTSSSSSSSSSRISLVLALAWLFFLSDSFGHTSPRTWSATAVILLGNDAVFISVRITPWFRVIQRISLLLCPSSLCRIDISSSKPRAV